MGARKHLCNLCTANCILHVISLDAQNRCTETSFNCQFHYLYFQLALKIQFWLKLLTAWVGHPIYLWMVAVRVDISLNAQNQCLEICFNCPFLVSPVGFAYSVLTETANWLSVASDIFLHTCAQYCVQRIICFDISLDAWNGCMATFVFLFILESHLS